jgi:flagellar biosynthesis/type III secretory pathway protein FliH
MNLTSAKSFAFPARNRIDAFERQADQARNAELERTFADAAARGKAEGLARGREEAKAEARELLEKSARDGLARGHEAALAEMGPAADALRSALAALKLERDNAAAEAEAFCVELALAIVARIIDADKARAEFARRATEAALKALAPETPTAICFNPADLKALRKLMSDLPLQEDATLASGTSRVEAGRLLVESSLDEAFAQIRAVVGEIKSKRTVQRPAATEPVTDAD